MIVLTLPDLKQTFKYVPTVTGDAPIPTPTVEVVTGTATGTVTQDTTNPNQLNVTLNSDGALGAVELDVQSAGVPIVRFLYNIVPNVIPVLSGISVNVGAPVAATPSPVKVA